MRRVRITAATLVLIDSGCSGMSLLTFRDPNADDNEPGDDDVVYPAFLWKSVG